MNGQRGAPASGPKYSRAVGDDSHPDNSIGLGRWLWAASTDRRSHDSFGGPRALFDRAADHVERGRGRVAAHKLAVAWKVECPHGRVLVGDGNYDRPDRLGRRAAGRSGDA